MEFHHCQFLVPKHLISICRMFTYQTIEYPRAEREGERETFEVLNKPIQLLTHPDDASLSKYFHFVEMDK